MRTPRKRLDRERPSGPERLCFLVPPHVSTRDVATLAIHSTLASEASPKRPHRIFLALDEFTQVPAGDGDVTVTGETTALIPAPKAEVTVVDGDPDARLSTWVVHYWREEIEKGSENTVGAKRRDLQQLFLDYFANTLRVNDLDAWMRSISRGFLHWLEEDAGYAPTTINRVLATLKHFRTYIIDRDGFRYGHAHKLRHMVLARAADKHGVN